jgi:hypothetical protein
VTVVLVTGFMVLDPEVVVRGVAATGFAGMGGGVGLGPANVVDEEEVCAKENDETDKIAKAKITEIKTTKPSLTKTLLNPPPKKSNLDFCFKA